MIAPNLDIDAFAEMVAERVAERLANRQQLVGRGELAKASGLSVRTIDRLAAEKKLPLHRSGRRVLFELEQALAAIRGLNA